jgi:hypothetical protein
MKRFGGRERPKTEEFELETIGDDGQQNVYQFQLVPLVPAADAVALMDALENEPHKSAGLISRLITKVLDNHDGVSAKWQPTPLDDDELKALKLKDPSYLGPDGEPYPFGNQVVLDKWTSREAGSSRRRWALLMDPANEESIQLVDLIEIAEWVVSLGTDRPTQARASSTGSRKPRR